MAIFVAFTRVATRAIVGRNVVQDALEAPVKAYFRRRIRQRYREVRGEMVREWARGIASVGSVAESLDVRITDGATPVLRQFRADVDNLLKRYAVEAAERHVLPTAKRRAPGSIGSSLVIRGGKRPYITTSKRGKRRQVVGLLEFGGTVRTPIVPKSGQAIKVAPGVIRARVDGPRTYKAQRFIGSAAEDRRQAFGEEVAGKLAAELQRRLGGSSFGGSMRF